MSEHSEEPEVIPSMDTDLSLPSTDEETLSDEEEITNEFVIQQLQKQMDKIWVFMIHISQLADHVKGSSELIKNLLKIHDVYLKTIKTNNPGNSSK